MTDFHDEAEELPVLSALEGRMLGAMIEKSLATPQNYPLSLNSLASACNQTTNRDPLTHYAESELDAVLADLKARRLLRFVHPTSGRGVTKYRSVLDERLGLDVAPLSVMSVLLVRGPQTVGELRTRTERLHRFESPDEVERCLRGLADYHPAPLVRQLEREPGTREPRWIQLLCAEQGEERITVGASHTAPASGPVSIGQASAGGADLASDVARLQSELQQLRAEFDAFRAEFG